MAEETGGVAASRLTGFIGRLEKLDDERRDINLQFNEVMKQAKGEGFSTKAIRELLKLRRMTPHDREENEQLREVYKAALGMA